MAEYFWNPALMRHVFAVPEEIVDRHLRLAGSVQLKVLLWVSRNGTFDAEACAAAIGVSAPDCADALQYWVAAGVFSGGEPAAAPVVAEPPAEEKPKTVTRPKVHKPQLPEVLARQKRDSEFDGLLTEVSVRMGRPLGNGDLETLLYLYETVGLPAAVILMVVGYAAQMGRINTRYIEKVALDWADRGIVTMAAAEEHLCYLERCEQSALRVQAVCRLEKPITAATAMRAAEKWYCEWQMTDEMVAAAYEICREKTGKFDARYMDRVLENWHAQGAKTPEEVENPNGKKAEKELSFDHTEYEDMVERYVPVYKKKKR